MFDLFLLSNSIVRIMGEKNKIVFSLPGEGLVLGLGAEKQNMHSVISSLVCLPSKW